MNAYAIFTAKRGRPKLEDAQIQINSTQIQEDIMSILLYLKQITKKQFESAQFYEVLYKKYLKLINAPTMNHNKSLISIQNKFCRTFDHNSSDDILINQKWTAIKYDLLQIHVKCESIIYRVVIEHKDKDVLLNPRSIAENQLAIFRQGLDKIAEYI